MPDKKVNDPHDTIFRSSFQDIKNVVDLINGTFPEEIVKNLKLETLTLDSTSYIDRNLKKYFSDLVYTCKYKETDILITILFEHKSYLPDYPHIQLLRYILNIQEHSINNAKKLILTLPIVFYHGKNKWIKKPFTDYFEIKDLEIQKYIPNFEYVLIDLSKYSDEEIKRKITGKLLAILLQIMKYSSNEDILNKNLEKIFRIGKMYIEEEDSLVFFEKIIRYLYEIADNLDVERLMEIVSENDDEAGGVIMSTATKLIQKGKLEGKLEGIIEGQAKKQIEIARRMLLKGVDIKTISELTDLTIVEVKKLKY